MDAKVTARKSTVRSQGARGVFTKTVFKPVVNGQVVQMGFPTREDAIAHGEKIVARWAN